jgi:hypothetical protein
MKPYNGWFDTDTQRHCARGVQVSVRLAAQCHCVPANSNVRHQSTDVWRIK